MKLLLSLAVLIFLAGLLLRLRFWFSGGVYPSRSLPSATTRLGAAAGRLGRSLIDGTIFKALAALVTDVLFQQRLFRAGLWRWTAHALIFAGFILLLLMHGLGNGVSEFFFGASYEEFAALQPYLSLRNGLGLMVLAGLALAVGRRLSSRRRQTVSAPSDWLAIAFVAAIILSGILLEGSRISSYSYYQEEMVEVYGAVGDEDEALALETYWAAEHGLASPNVSRPYDPELVEQGREISSYSCAECHAPASGAFLSFALARIGGPVLGPSQEFWFWLHFLSCLAFLAWLPFSKMFHVLATPVSLVVNSIAGFKRPAGSPAETLNRQALGLTACTHCGACSDICSSLTFYDSFKNDFILPSEKVQLLKRMAQGRSIEPATLERLQQGLYICTSCDRCSTVCPSGINLRELFVDARYALLAQGPPEPTILSHFSFPLALARTFVADHREALRRVERLFKESFRSLADIELLSPGEPAMVGNDSYQSCYSCQRCTNICPIVRRYDNPVQQLDLLPHQIIYALGLGDRELAAGARMIWSCSTCYLCQEHCPNQVELTDIFYRLKNIAINEVGAGGTA